MTHEDFRLAAREIGRRVATLFSSEEVPGVGVLVKESVEGMLDRVGVNTSLGTILLLAPMCLCPEETYPRICRAGTEDVVLERDVQQNPIHWNVARFREALLRVLEGTNAADSQAIYDAIRMTQPGGLGVAAAHDVSAKAPDSILEGMRVAAAWDDIALQYTNGFVQVCEGAMYLLRLAERETSLEQSVRMLQLRWLMERPDSLIVRKHGQEVGREIQDRARVVFHAGEYGSVSFEEAWEELDRSMRVSGKRMNPGTTADLIAGALFLAQDAFGSLG